MSNRFLHRVVASGVMRVVELVFFVAVPNPHELTVNIEIANKPVYALTRRVCSSFGEVLGSNLIRLACTVCVSWRHVCPEVRTEFEQASLDFRNRAQAVKFSWTLHVKTDLSKMPGTLIRGRVARERTSKRRTLQVVRIIAWLSDATLLTASSYGEAARSLRNLHPWNLPRTMLRLKALAIKPLVSRTILPWLARRLLLASMVAHGQLQCISWLSSCV